MSNASSYSRLGRSNSAGGRHNPNPALTWDVPPPLESTWALPPLPPPPPTPPPEAADGLASGGAASSLSNANELLAAAALAAGAEGCSGSASASAQVSAAPSAAQSRRGSITDAEAPGAPPLHPGVVMLRAELTEASRAHLSAIVEQLLAAEGVEDSQVGFSAFPLL